MKVSAMAEYLKFRAVPFEEITHQRTSAALEEAGALGAPPSEVLKPLVVHGAHGYAVVVILASRRVDMRLVREAVDDGHARLATEDELERAFSGYELGAMTPLGSLIGATTFVDPEVFLHGTVTFATGSEKSIRCGTADLFGSEPISVVPLTEAGISERELVG